MCVVRRQYRPAGLLVLLGLTVALLPTAILRGQSPEPPASPVDVSKVRLYLKTEMYREAIRDLEPAIKTDEFNSDLRLLYGTALRHVRRYDDSLYNLSIAIKLNGSNWAALDELLNLYVDRYAESQTNSDRISALKTATLLMSMRGAETNQSELESAKQRAGEVMARFEDPVGLWRSGQQEFEIVRQPNGMFRLSEHPPSGQKCAQACFIITFNKAKPPMYEGSGSNSDSSCVFEFSYELSFSDAATKLSVTGRHVQYRVPDVTVGSSDLTVLRARHKMCAAMVRDGVFASDKQMAFERVH